MSPGVGADGLTMGLAEWLMGLEKGLLEQLMGLGMGLWCGVGTQLVDVGWLFAGDWLQGGSLMWMGAVV